MNLIIIILAVEFAILGAFIWFIHRMVKKDIERYRRQRHLPL